MGTFSKMGSKIRGFKESVIVGAMVVASDMAMAQQTGGGGAAQQSANKVAGAMQAFLGLMPIAAKIMGIAAIIGGGWSLYKHFKSDGRDGSIPGGIAGLIVGVLLYFVAGFLNFGADSIGIQTGGGLPN